MLTHRVGVLPCGERIKPCWVQIKPCWHLLPIRETGLKCLFLLVCFLQLNCSNVVAISSDKAACEGCVALFWYVVTLTKALHSLFELLFQVVTFLSVLYNSDILTISVRERGGMRESSLWITLGLNLVGRWGKRAQGQEGGSSGNVVWKSAQPHQLKGTRYKVLAAGMRLNSSSLLSPLAAHFMQVNSHMAGTKGQLFMAPDTRLWLLTQHPDFSCVF